MKTINQIKTEIENKKCRSAWKRGVKVYALELLNELAENRAYDGLDEYVNSVDIKQELLNGAKTWYEYSYGGCSLIYDYEIAERLCTPSELKRTKGGERQPHSFETWLDAQGRALFQAYEMIKECAKEGE